MQQSSQQLVQSLKQEREAAKAQLAEKTAEMRGVVDSNLALKQELGKLQEAAKEAADAESKRKAECETLIAQIGKLNAQAAADAAAGKAREGALAAQVASARETAAQVLHALQTLQTGFQQLVATGVFQSGDAQWNVRNVSGAANFAIRQLLELSQGGEANVGQGRAFHVAGRARVAGGDGGFANAGVGGVGGAAGVSVSSSVSSATSSIDSSTTSSFSSSTTSSVNPSTSSTTSSTTPATTPSPGAHPSAAAGAVAATDACRPSAADSLEDARDAHVPLFQGESGHSQPESEEEPQKSIALRYASCRDEETETITCL